MELKYDFMKISDKKFKIFQKTVIIVLIFSFSFGAGFLVQPKKTSAAWGILDVNVDSPANWWSAIMKFYSNYKVTFDTVKDILVQTFAKKALDYITNETIQWIQGEGDPAFITDFEGFIKDIGDQAGAEFLNQLTGIDFCGPWGTKIKTALSKPKKFSTRAKCTLSKIGANFEDFMNDFNKGGWAAWLSVSESQNNPYGSYLMALNEKLYLEGEKKETAKNKAIMGSGFLGNEVCMQIEDCDIDTGECHKESGEWKKSDIPAGAACQKWESKTPATLMADMLEKSVGSNTTWLTGKEKWTSYVVAILDALINRIVKEGIMAVTTSDTDGTSGGSTGFPAPPVIEYDMSPPVTQATTSDAWHITLVPNETVLGVFFTTNGNEPQVDVINTSPYNSSDPVSVPILANNTTVKWFSVDQNYNQEATHTQQFNPPFSTTTVSTVAGAVDSTTVVLLTNKPATIYYSIDGSYPTNRYLKKINVPVVNASNSGSVLRWFGVDINNNQESTVHFLTLTPPFPQPKSLKELIEIYDFVNPVANIVAPSSASQNQFFALDPSLSTDDDNTPKIVMYEWDFDNDGNYDWWTTDYNRDGIFEEKQCKQDSSGVVNTYCSVNTTIGAGFAGMQVLTGAPAGKIEVKYSASGVKTIRLRVTDDEGLYTEKSVNVNM